MKKPLLLFALFVQAHVLIGQEPGTATKPPVPVVQKADVAAPKMGPDGKINPNFQSAHEKFNKIAAEGNGQLLFLGDSITAGWNGKKEIWEKEFSAYKPINFGIGGDRTQHVLWRITNGELENLKLKGVVLMIGTNNSGSDSAEDIAKGITVIVETIRSKQPQAKILLLAVFPRGEKANPNPSREKISKVNEQIAKLHDGKQIHFLDIGSKFLQEDGSLTKEIMPDFLHLSAAGYQIWADSIQTKLKEIMN